MQKITDVREIQKIEINILRHFKKVCEKHGLTYYLSNGTLLGAVKYQKFIPWDDDIDVFMPRKDFEQLMSIDEINTDIYHLMAREREPEWKLPFAKLCDMRTCKQENSAEFGLDFGLEIDIFPLDCWVGGTKQAARSGLWRRGLSASLKSRFETPKTGWRKAVLFVIWKVSRWCGSSFFLKCIDAEVEKGYQISEPKYLGSVAWSLYGSREVIAANVFRSKTKVLFEGDTYWAPAGYDQYLRGLYGDYIQDPPPEKQVTHHNFMVFWR